MNAFKLMISKNKVDYLYDYNTFQEGLDKLNDSGFSAIPVIREDGTYAGTVCDKDFLVKYSEEAKAEFEDLCIDDIIKIGWNPAINVSKDINDLLLLSMEQNFVPVVDDMNTFLGIITRRRIIKYLTEEKPSVQNFNPFEGKADAKKMELAFNQLEKNVEPYEIFTKMYVAAMKEICIRLETIGEMLTFKNNRKPLHHIDKRIKSPRSVMGKLARKQLEATVDNMRENLYDIAGVRVICSYISDVYEFAQYLEEQTDLILIKKKDYIVNPKPNGYRSLHLIVEVPINYIGAMKMIPVEIQFRTEPMDYWASLEHDLKYKPIFNEKGIDVSKELKECSNELAKTEEKMQELSSLLLGTDLSRNVVSEE